MLQELQKCDNKEFVALSEERKGVSWLIVYGLDKFYLTDDERQYFLDSIEGGAKFVQIKGNILTDRFSHITKVEVEHEDWKDARIPFRHENEPEITDEEQARRDKAREKCRRILTEKGILKKKI